MDKIKQILLVIVILAGVYITYQNKRIQALNRDVSNGLSLIKAYDADLDTLNNNTRIYKMSISQLNYYKDSVLKKLNLIKEELKIKNKNVEQLQYLLSKANKVDSVIIRDTIFSKNFTRLDTILGNKWYKLNLSLVYPNKITIKSSYTSEKYIIIHNKRETIKPPKKFFLFRWFQKKHTVLRVEVVEKNPYISNVRQKFIKIIR